MLILAFIGHVMAGLLVGGFLLACYRWIHHRSKILGTIVAATIVARVAVGAALFWISYLHLPIAASLQQGGGFWNPALDATGYYEIAAGAADRHALFAVSNADVPSPFFIDALALSMMGLGVSPAAGVLMNLCLYVALVVMIVWAFNPMDDWRRDLPCIVGIAAYSFSPVILIHSTQPLKDELTNFLAALACIGVLQLTPLVHSAGGARPAKVLAASIAIAFATYGIAGVRWYFAFILWCGGGRARVMFCLL
jgi:hypothetical protein